MGAGGGFLGGDRKCGKRYLDARFRELTVQTTPRKNHYSKRVSAGSGCLGSCFESIFR